LAQTEEMLLIQHKDHLIKQEDRLQRSIMLLFRPLRILMRKLKRRIKIVIK